MGKKVIFFMIVMSFFCACGCKNSGEEKNNRFGQNDWAFYNFGQVVNESYGVDGVDINIVKAWELVGEATDVKVGLVDTGIEYSDDDENKFVWRNQEEIPNNEIDDDGNGYIDDVYGWDFYNYDCTIYDGYLYDYHGTYIANMLIRIAPGMQIISSKFLKGTQGDAIDAIDAIAYAIENGAQIINCSWCFEREEERLYKLIEDNPSILFVCAAGNANLNLDEVKVYPASYSFDNLISVMAIGNKGEKYELSGYGLNVDIASPGKDIEVVLPEGDVTYVNGTSIATAYVTGAAALLKSYKQELTPYEIKKLIIESAHKTETLAKCCKAGGFLDVYATIVNCK